MREKQNSAEYQETKQHGSRLFPFNIYPCTIPLDFPVVSLHWHKEMELIYVKKGKGQIQLETENYEGNPGDIFVVTPGTLHSIHRIKGYAMEYENIIFEMDFLGEGAADLCAGEFLVPLASGRLLPPVCIRKGEEHYEALKRCLVQMEELCEKKEKGYELGVKAAVLQMIFLLIRKYPSIEEISSPDRERLKEVLQEIGEKIDQSLTAVSYTHLPYSILYAEPDWWYRTWIHLADSVKWSSVQMGTAAAFTFCEKRIYRYADSSDVATDRIYDDHLHCRSEQRISGFGRSCSDRRRDKQTDLI